MTMTLNPKWWPAMTLGCVSDWKEFKSGDNTTKSPSLVIKVKLASKTSWAKMADGSTHTVVVNTYCGSEQTIMFHYIWTILPQRGTSVTTVYNLSPIHTSLQGSGITKILIIFYSSSTHRTAPQGHSVAVPQCSSQ